MLALLHIPRGLRYYDDALEGLTRINERLYRARLAPSVYARGADGRRLVRYEQERGTEEWRHAVEVTREGYGDCEDLACARAGELRAKGNKRARAFASQSAPNLVHIKVDVHGDGKTIEDPSRVLGMGKHQGTVIYMLDDYDDSSGFGFDDDGDDDSSGDDGGDDTEVEMGADPSTSAEISWHVERTPEGWRGVVRIPLWQGHCAVVKSTVNKNGVGPKGKEGAAQVALRTAAKVLDNPAIAAVIPGEAKFALNLVRSKKARELASTISKLF